MFIAGGVSLLLVVLALNIKLPETGIMETILNYALVAFYLLVAAGILGGFIFRIVEQIALRKYGRAVFFIFLLLTLLFIIVAAILPSNKAFYNWVQSRHQPKETPAQTQEK